MRIQIHSAVLIAVYLGIWLYPSGATAGIVETADNFNAGMGDWVHVGLETGGIIDRDDYSYYDGTPGDGLPNDGGLVLNTANGMQGDEAMGLTLDGQMETGEEIAFSGSWYNDNSSYSRNNAQLWNLTDGTLLAESGSTLVNAYGTPVAFDVSYTAVASDDGDTLQIRFREDNNHAARDIFVDHFNLTSSMPGTPTNITNVVFNHPRLFFSTNELAAIQAKRLTSHADEWAQLLAVCNSRMGTTPTTDPRNASGLLGYEDVLAALALVQAVDPSQPYHATGKNWFMTILNWTEWGPGYWAWPDYGPRGNLETGEILRALAVWYDLQYHTLTEAEQIDASQKLADYAYRFRNSYSRFWTTDNGELTGNHCWNAFASLAAVLYASDHVSSSRQADWNNLLDGHYATISNLMTTVMSDGVTGEGMTYWTYGLEKVLLWFNMRQVAGKPAYEGIDWFENTGTYGMFGVTPGGADNFGGLSRYDDANPDFWGNPYNELSLLAAAVGDPVAQWMANELDHQGAAAKNAYRYIFYDPSVPSLDPDSELNNWHFFNDYGMFFWRSSWSTDAQHFTIRSGQHSHGHSKGDDGQFMLSRNGIPYIVNLGYAVPRYARDCNVLLVNGTGQYSDGDDWGTVFNASWPANTDIWGKTLHVLANDAYYQKGDFFNLLVDPTHMYTNPALSSWQREVVGLGGDLYLMRDSVDAGESVAFDLLLHGQVTVPSGDTYDQDTYATANPWTVSGAEQWELDARPGSPKLLVQDLSADTWTPVIEESWYYDKYDSTPPTRRGSKLRRSLTGISGTSLLSLGFDDLMSGWTQSAWTNGTAEGIHVMAAGVPVIDVLWPLDGNSVSASDGWSVTGSMAGRRFDGSFFGRNITLMQYNGMDLISATTPVSFHARTEHIPGGSRPNRIYIRADAASTLSLYAPYAPRSVQLDGADIGFSWTNNQVTLSIPATDASIIDLVDAAYLEWRDGYFSPAEIFAGQSALTGDPDSDDYDNWTEFITDTDPRSEASWWDLHAGNGAFTYGTSTARLYTVEYRTNLLSGDWNTQVQNVSGTGSDISINDTNEFASCYYRVGVSLP